MSSVSRFLFLYDSLVYSVVGFVLRFISVNLFSQRLDCVKFQFCVCFETLKYLSEALPLLAKVGLKVIKNKVISKKILFR